MMQLVLCILTLVVALAELTAVTSSSSPTSCTITSRITSSHSLPFTSRRPLLLFYDTEGVNYEMYSVWFGESDRAYLHCPVQCEIKSGRDRTLLQRAEAVMFWSTPLGKGLDINEKCPSQLWLQSSTEAADITILDRTPPLGMMSDGITPSPIDFEVTWRRTLGERKVSWLNNYDWNIPLDSYRTPVFPIPHTKTRAGRDPDQAAVAMFVSNCGATSRRLEVMRELQKYIKIDSYGSCAHNRDIPSHWTEEHDTSRGLLHQKNVILKKRYKFLLAFENQQTDDYVTEKFYHPLSIGVLPIVLGAPNINSYSPSAHIPNMSSFLNVDDFSDLRLLAEKIDELDKNDTEYESYFTWRSLPTFSPLFTRAAQYSWRESPCQVCQKIHEELYDDYVSVSLDEQHWNRHIPTSETRVQEAVKNEKNRRKQDKQERDEL